MNKIVKVVPIEGRPQEMMEIPLPQSPPTWRCTCSPTVDIPFWKHRCPECENRLGQAAYQSALAKQARGGAPLQRYHTKGVLWNNDRQDFDHLGELPLPEESSYPEFPDNSFSRQQAGEEASFAKFLFVFTLLLMFLFLAVGWMINEGNRRVEAAVSQVRQEER